MKEPFFVSNLFMKQEWDIKRNDQKYDMSLQEKCAYDQAIRTDIDWIS